MALEILEMGLESAWKISLTVTGDPVFSFFRVGVTRACFRALGTVPSCIDLLTKVVIIGSSSSTHSFSNHVGMGSKELDLLGSCLMIRRISSLLTDAFPHY